MIQWALWNDGMVFVSIAAVVSFIPFCKWIHQWCDSYISYTYQCMFSVLKHQTYKLMKVNERYIIRKWHNTVELLTRICVLIAKVKWGENWRKRRVSFASIMFHLLQLYRAQCACAIANSFISANVIQFATINII